MEREGLVHGILHLSVSVFIVSSNYCFILRWLNLLVQLLYNIHISWMSQISALLGFYCRRYCS